MRYSKLVSKLEAGEVRSEFLCGIRFDAVDYDSSISLINKYLNDNKLGKVKGSYVVTPHSEFIYKALVDERFKNLINSSYLSLPDGISVIWVENFLGRGVYFKNKYLMFMELFLQFLLTSITVFLKGDRAGIYIKERVIGADLVEKLFAMAEASKFKIFLLGGYAGVGKKVANMMEKKYTALEDISCYEGSPSEKEKSSIVDVVNKAKADLLIVAYGSIKQDEWIESVHKVLNVGLSIGVGRSLDYIAGYYKKAPYLFVRFGIEWLYKACTDFSRIKRQLVVFKLMFLIFKIKYFDLLKR